MNHFLGQLRRKNLLSVSIALSFLGGTFLTGCSPLPDYNSSGQEPLKLGALLPVSGALASSNSKNLPEVVKMAVDEINACGGVNGKPVTLILEDTQTDPAVGATAMTKLVEVDKVAGVVGARASSVSNVAADIAARNRVMLISPASTSPILTSRARMGDFDGYWARTVPSDSYQAQALAALAKKQGFKKVATIAMNNDYGIGFERQFVAAFGNLGGKVVNDADALRYDPQATTLETEVKTVFADKPEAVMGVFYVDKGSLFLKSAYQQKLGQDVQLLLTDGVYSPDFVQKVGKNEVGNYILSGALGTVPGANGQGLEAFTTKWKQKSGKEMDSYLSNAWDATILLMLAAQASNSNTGRGIQSTIRQVSRAPGKEVSDPCEAMRLLRQGEDINYQGASGNVDLDENGDVMGSYNVWKVKEDGSLAIIDQVSPIIQSPK